jgi:hypothetical protein
MLDLLKGMPAVFSKYKFVMLFTDFLTELLFYQDLQIGLIIYYQYLNYLLNLISFSFNKLKSSGFVNRSSAPSEAAD